MFLCFFLEGLVVDLVLERESLLIEIEREREVVQNQQEINGYCLLRTLQLVPMNPYSHGGLYLNDQNTLLIYHKLP